MKSKIIAIVSGLAVLGLGIFAVVQMNGSNRMLSIIAITLSLIPMYFLYATVVLGKFDEKKDKALSSQQRLERMIQSSKYIVDKKYIKKAANDYGKVLDFPTDRNRKSNKNK